MALHMQGVEMQRFQASGVGEYFIDFALHRLAKLARLITPLALVFPNRHPFIRRIPMKCLRSFALTLALRTSAISAQAGNMLIILPDPDHLDLKDGKVFETGFYLNETRFGTELADYSER
jgi:hypothetical protein